MRSSMLLSLAAASISAIYAQQVVLDRTKLVNWDSCNSEQQKIIKETWKDATKLAGGTKNIDWSSAAAVQFLGPGGRNDEHRLIMQRILNNAATFGPAWWFNPFTEKVQIRCRETNNCTGKIAAYTQNPPFSGDEPLINFCELFFRTDSLSRVIERAKNEKHRSIKYNLNNYVNRGYILLHEMMHIDKIVKPIGGKSIGDLCIAYRDIMGEEKVSKVQGPFLTKLLARRLSLGGHDVGYWIRSTADNMAWYAMAMHVQKQLGDYPSLPLVSGSIERIWAAENRTTEMLQVKDEEPFKRLSDNGLELADSPNWKAVVELKDIEFATDNGCPEPYTKQLKK